MKKFKCLVCGTENREKAKYCRICFSKLLVDSTYKNLPFNTNFYSKVTRHRNFFVLVFLFLLSFMLWILVR